MDYKEKVIALLNSQELSKEQKEKLESIFPELSESEDERIRKALVDTFKFYDSPMNSPYLVDISKKDILAWLEKQKIEKQGKQKPAEWSEEDERMYRGLHNLIYSTPYCDSRKEFSDWFKTLKERYTWKPSDEQMIAIQEAMNIVGILTITGSKINSLYQDLKKLKNDKL